MRSNILFIILSMALVTYLTRFGSLALFRFTGIPVWLHGWLKHVPVAILTALIVPALLLPKGTLDISLSNPYLMAGIAAAAAAYKTRHIIPTLGLGMLVMLGYKHLML